MCMKCIAKKNEQLNLGNNKTKAYQRKKKDQNQKILKPGQNGFYCQ